MRWWALTRKIHVSWLIAYLSTGIILGVISAQYVPSSLFAGYAWATVGCALAGLALWKQRRYGVIIIVVAGCLIGLWRGSVSQRVLAPYQRLVGYTVTIYGTVAEDVDTGKNGETVLRLHGIVIDGHKMAGEIWASTNDKADIKRSDVVRLRGKLAAGFGSFAASMYRASLLKIQRPQPGDVARQVRDAFADNVRRTVPEPEASLGIGYLVGQRRALPENLDNALRIAGLMHVVVASGYNLTILVRLARRLFVKVSKYLAAFASVSMIVGFIAVTGASPSMSRAGLVAGLSLLAWYYGRRFHPLVLLPLVAAITLLVTPSYGWNNLGWQLSFASFAGVMIVAPLAQVYFFGETKPGTIRQILGETITAQLMTLPILVMAFGYFSNVAILANLLVLPLVPLAMLLTFVTGISSLLLPLVIANIISVPAQWLLQYMTSVAQYLAGLPWAQTTLTVGWQFVLGYYVVIIAASAYMWHKTKYHLRESNIVV